MVKRIHKNISLSPPNLAPLRLGGRNFQIREFSTPESLRQSRKFRAIVIRLNSLTFVNFASFVVNLFFLAMASGR